MVYYALETCILASALYVALMLRFVIAILLLAVPSVAQSAENCPSGQVREVRERVVTPASFLDILSDREVVTESTEILTIPAQWSWLEKPKDYVRPKFVEVEEIHVGSFKWSSAEVEISYQAESHDIIKNLMARHSAELFRP